MTIVSQLLEHKGVEVWSIEPDAMVADALKLMAEKDVGALLVMEDKRIAGIVSERDYARKVLLRNRTSRETPVRDIMSTRVVTARPEQTVEHCMGMMTDRRIRHLPVVDEDTVVGVISIGDLVKAIISEQRETIEQLESYIRG